MFHRFFAAGLLALAVAGCNSSSNTSQPAGDAPGASAPNGGGATAASTPAASAPSTSATAAPKAFVRGVHVVPGAGAVSLKVAGKSAGGPFTFGNASSFVAVEPGEDVEITAVGAGNTRVAGPMPVDLERGEDLTVVVNGVPGDVALLPFEGESGGPEAGQSKITFAHAAKELGEVEVSIDGQRYRGDVEYGEDTDYKTLPPGRHTFAISYSRPSKATPAPTPTLVPNQVSPQPTPARLRETVSLQQQADLAAGKVYTLVLFYDAAKNPKARLLEDRFADTLANAPAAR